MSISRKFLDVNKSIQEEVNEIKLKDVATKRLEKAGIPKIKQPTQENYLEFPDDVSEIPNRDLGKYLGVYEAEAGWVSYCIARREIDLDHAKVLLIFVYNKLLNTFSLSVKSIDRKIKVEADKFYLGCKMDVKDIEADISLLRASLGCLERYAKAISREITNRKVTYESFPSGRVDNPGAVFGGEND